MKILLKYLENLPALSLSKKLTCTDYVQTCIASADLTIAIEIGVSRTIICSYFH